MKIAVLNFGGFKGAHVHTIESQTLPNGKGKTSMINAYVFALSGRTLNGFVVKNVDRGDEPVNVTLHDFLDLPPIRRVAAESGTELYVGDELTTQEDFVNFLASRGYDLEFIVACANANVLTSNGLDTAALRKILARTDVLPSDDYDALKKELTAVRKKRKAAEQYALTNVVVPIPVWDAVTPEEKTFAASFKRMKMIVNDGVVCACPHCERAYDDEKIDALNKEFEVAEVSVKQNIAEFTRIMLKQSAFMEEMQTIDDKRRLLDTATKARKDLVRYDAEIALINEEIRELDAESVKAHLPEYVDVITEVPQKNGKMKATCTLEYQGVSLRSINHAKRIEICVNILNHARSQKGMSRVPIIVDNAEAVEHNFSEYENVIRFSAPRQQLIDKMQK